MNRINNQGTDLNLSLPCRAIDAETKQLIKVFDSRTECSKHFNVTEQRIVNAIARNGCIRVNGKRIAIRNYHTK